jgi:tRNA threonylcarbamoyladenosine biosynthesis protein TsaE
MSVNFNGLVEKITSNNVEETFEVGFRLGQELEGGEVISLSGMLGAGKTVFVKGLASALGIDSGDVTSPSFTLVNKYDGSLRLYHLDLYRLNEGIESAYAVDLDELLRDKDAVIIIEWAERLGTYPLPVTSWYISISGDGEEPREVTIRRG